MTDAPSDTFDVVVRVGEVASLEIADDRLVGVRLASGAVVAREAVAVSPRMVARAGFLAGLGIQPTSHPMGEYIEADRTGRTAVPGVWVVIPGFDRLATYFGHAERSRTSRSRRSDREEDGACWTYR
ncbi:hypothetical protein SAMN05661093_10482 [Kibdelosporangium aridum]|uniref:Uncharacterized protein n=1 Tax=Kibdelosporangium aridum TaxID=2030 RepID=A0A1Y5Y9T0_KIBAR|nr:hypothetical protein SAMN05661093_10482 [Kibdelosporangium aridum]